MLVFTDKRIAELLTVFSSSPTFADRETASKRHWVAFLSALRAPHLFMLITGLYD
jgi:hypothetical protein